MSNNIVKLSVLLSANAAQASTEVTKFAADARKSAADTKAAFDGLTTTIKMPTIPDMGKSMAVEASAAIEVHSTAVGHLASEFLSLGAAVVGVQGFMSSLERGFELAEKAEQSHISFKLLTGDIATAGSLLNELKKSAREMSVSFGTLRNAGQQMLKYGFDPKDIRPTLSIITNFGAALGDVEGTLSGVVEMMGVLRDKPAFDSRSMRTLIQFGLQPYEELSRILGKTKEEIKGMLDAGSISVPMGMSAMFEAMQRRGEGGTEERAGTVAGKAEAMKREWDSVLKGAGEGAINLASGIVAGVKEIVSGIMSVTNYVANQLSGAWSALKQGVSDTFGYLGSFLPEFTGKALLITGGILVGVSLLTAALPALAAGIMGVGVAVQFLLGPWNLVITAITAATAALLWFFAKSAENAKPNQGIVDAQTKAAETVAARHGMSADSLKDNSAGAWWKQNKQLAGEMADEIDRNIKLSGKFGKVSVSDLALAQGAVSPVVAEFTKLKAKMEESIGDIGLKEDVKDIKKLMANGGTPEMLKELSILQERKKAAKEDNDMTEEGIKLAEKMRTAQEELSDDINHLNKMMNAGKISSETYSRAMEMVNQKFQEHDSLSKLVNKDTEELQDRLEKATFGKDELQIKKLTDAGADASQLHVVMALQDAVNAQEKLNKLKEEATKLNESELTGLDKVKEVVAKVAELRENGLSDAAASTMLKKSRDEYIKDQEHKNKITAPGLALAGSQEAYKVMLNSTKADPAKDASKQFDEIVAATQGTKAAAEKQNNNFTDLKKLLTDIRQNTSQTKEQQVAAITGGTN